MTASPMPDLIVIDDDPINNMICVKMLRHLLPMTDVKAFTQPSNGISHITGSYSNNDDKLVLFLDIDMPALSGWEVLQQIGLLPADLKKRMQVFILTSSVDPVDRLSAANDPLVASFITKPLSQEKLRMIFPQHVK